MDSSHKINIEQQFQSTIQAVKKCLSVSEILIQNENVDDRLILDAYIKNKNKQKHAKMQATSSSDPENGIYKAYIYLPLKCQISKNPIKVRKFDGTIRYTGVISSRVWCNPKCTIGDVKKYLREDILRSMSARIQVYCDGLTEPNVSTDAIFISEPPRRVYFSLPPPEGAKLTASQPIQFSDYIFRGEAATVAVAQAKEILDLDITSDNIVADIEGLPEDEAFSMKSYETNSTMDQATGSAINNSDFTRTMYMLGIAVALLVLILSVLLHYVIGK